MLVEFPSEPHLVEVRLITSVASGMIMMQILKSIFGKGQSPKYIAAYERMKQKRDEVGGSFHFTVTVDEDGWHAQCDEIEAIMTGGTSKYPTNEEIERRIREAIHTAFSIEVEQEEPDRIVNKRNVAAFYDFGGRERVAA